MPGDDELALSASQRVADYYNYLADGVKLDA